MEQEYGDYDFLRIEFFEKLFPHMLLEGSLKEREDFFQALKKDGKNLIHFLYAGICQEDQKQCPYQKDDFGVEIFNRDGINILKIILPPYNPNTNDILRAYLLFVEHSDRVMMKKYFVIKRFSNGQVYMIHINLRNEKMIGEELTEHVGDMEYEYWRLINVYMMLMMEDIRNKKE